MKVFTEGKIHDRFVEICFEANVSRTTKNLEQYDSYKNKLLIIADSVTKARIMKKTKHNKLIFSFGAAELELV